MAGWGKVGAEKWGRLGWGGGEKQQLRSGRGLPIPGRRLPQRQVEEGSLGGKGLRSSPSSGPPAGAFGYLVGGGSAGIQLASRCACGCKGTEGGAVKGCPA